MSGALGPSEGINRRRLSALLKCLEQLRWKGPGWPDPQGPAAKHSPSSFLPTAAMPSARVTSCVYRPVGSYGHHPRAGAGLPVNTPEPGTWQTLGNTCSSSPQPRVCLCRLVGDHWCQGHHNTACHGARSAEWRLPAGAGVAGRKNLPAHMDGAALPAHRGQRGGRASRAARGSKVRWCPHGPPITWASSGRPSRALGESNT